MTLSTQNQVRGTGCRRSFHWQHWYSAHNIMAIMGAVVLLSFWLMLALLYRRPGSLLRCALAAMVAAALSATFWLPAVADLPLVQIDEARTGYFAVGEHFLRLQELLALQPVFLDSRAGNPLMVPSFTFGAPQLLTVIVGLLGSIFVKRRGDTVLGNIWRFVRPSSSRSHIARV